MPAINATRRRLMQWFTAAGGLFALNQARAHHTDTHFEDASDHKIVYQCNKADDDYIRGILFSVGELIRKHGDNVEVIVARKIGRETVRYVRNIFKYYIAYQLAAENRLAHQAVTDAVE